MKGLAAWTKHVREQLVLDALRATPARYEAVLLAALGAPVRATDEARRLVALAIVRTALPIVNAKALDVLLSRLEVADPAIGDLDADSADLAYVSRRRSAYAVTSWLLHRTGACAVPRRARPTRETIERTVLALKQAERRSKRTR